MNWQPIIGVSSLLVATITLYICIKLKELVDTQKTLTLLALLAPACKEPSTWESFIRYLAQGNRLQGYDKTDEKYLIELLERLGVKVDLNKERLVEAIPAD